MITSQCHCHAPSTMYLNLARLASYCVHGNDQTVDVTHPGGAKACWQRCTARPGICGNSSSIPHEPYDLQRFLHSPQLIGSHHAWHHPVYVKAQHTQQTGLHNVIHCAPGPIMPGIMPAIIPGIMPGMRYPAGMPCPGICMGMAMPGCICPMANDCCCCPDTSTSGMLPCMPPGAPPTPPEPRGPPRCDCWCSAGT